MEGSQEVVGQAPAPYDGFDRMPIAGRWRVGQSRTVKADRNPYSGETILEIQQANGRDVDDAFVAAARLQRGWAATSPQVRRDVMLRAAAIFDRRKQELIDWLIREAGSPRRKAEYEWEIARLYLDEAANYPLHAEGEIIPSPTRGKESRIYRKAAGVVGVISPWNFPLHLSNRSVAPALALGNTVVIKPASDTPVTGGLLLAKIYEEAGLPSGVLSVVVGAGSEVGDAFIDHPAPRILSFTGSTAVGRHIGEHAGRNVKRVCLELGGNCPFVVLDDADLKQAVYAAVAGKFLHQGQICIAINRILVDQSIYTEFLDRFVEHVGALEVGDPANDLTTIGPIINKTQLDAIRQKIDATLPFGASLELGGDPTGPSGLVLPPHVLADVTNQMPVAHEEVFGPVAPVIAFDGDDEAIRIANDTEYGLSSAVFTRDLERGLRVAQRIEAGMTHINDWPVNDEANAAFGGEKASGIGRFGGRWALDEFTTVHWISVQHQPRPYPIALPWSDEDEADSLLH